MGLTTTTKLFASLLTHYMSMSILATTSLDLDTYTHMDSHVYVCMYVSDQLIPTLGCAMIANWFKVLPRTARFLSLLTGFEFHPENVRILEWQCILPCTPVSIIIYNWLIRT